MKLVCWDGNGVWLCLRRLHRGQVAWPEAGQDTWQLSEAQWSWLVAGVDWQRLSAPAPAQWRL
jgi:transposase